MSRVGKLPITIPGGVKVEIESNKVKIEGPKGVIERVLPKTITVSVSGDEMVVSTKGKSDQDKALHGTYRAHLANMVKGVAEGWKKELEMVGTGYRAEIGGNKIILTVGFSHPVEFEIPDGLTVNVQKNDITIEGVDKDKLGQFAANIRAVRPPEPYKGKGIKYKEEVVRRKPGKAAKAVGAPA